MQRPETTQKNWGKRIHKISIDKRLKPNGLLLAHLHLHSQSRS